MDSSVMQCIHQAEAEAIASMSNARAAVHGLQTLLIEPSGVSLITNTSPPRSAGKEG